MNNLKRVLSLALSGIMLVGMMAVGAGAVNGKDFTDADKIQHTEAVNTLVTLNVINGKDDGSHYDPEGTLTRAEMCKLIVYVLNGGKEPVLSTKATPTYSDIGGHWAEKYIEYCSNLKIVAGQGDGTFNPGGVLTGSQAAKMMLTAMNYNSDVFHFTGADWELSVNSEANKAKLYEDLDGLDASAPISRDAAAQLVYNGMLARTMNREWNQNMSDLAITEVYKLTGPTLFSDKFDGVAYEGILVTSGKYSINATATAKDSFKVQLKKQDSVALTSPATTGYPTLDSVRSFKWEDQDLTALAGEYVKVLYNDNKKEVYGVYRVEDMNTVISTTTDKTKDIKVDEITINGDVYDSDVDFSSTINRNFADNVKFVDNDDDNSINLAIVNSVGLYKISYVGSNTFTMSFVSGRTNATSTTQKLEDVISYEGMKKDDYVLVTKDLYTQKDKLDKAEVIEDKITGRREATTGANTANANEFEYRIADTWYGMVGGTGATGYGYGTSAFSNNASVKYITVGGKLYYIKPATTTSLSDVAMLISVETSASTTVNTTARLLFSDGSKKTVTLDPDGTIPASTDCGKLYYFEEDGSYELTPAATQGDVGDYKYIGNTTVNLTDKDGATTGDIAKVTATGGTPAANQTGVAGDIADDAVVFLFKASNATLGTAHVKNDGKVISGKDLKTLEVEAAAIATAAKTADGVVQAVEAYSKKSNGLTRIAAVAATCSVYNDVTPAAPVNATWPTATSSANYGYLTAKPYTTTEDGTRYVVYPVWNGSETVDYKVAASSIAKFADGTSVAKHDVIGYDLVDGSTIKNVTAISLTKAAITGLDGNQVQFKDVKDASMASKTYKFNGDTEYLYVDSNADKASDIGVAGGSVVRATELVSNVYVENVKVLANSNNEVLLLVVDTDNKLADANTVATPLTDGILSFSKTRPAIGDIITVSLNAGTNRKLTSITLPATNAVIANLGNCTGNVSYDYSTDSTGNIIVGVSVEVLVTSSVGGSVSVGLSATPVAVAP